MTFHGAQHGDRVALRLSPQSRYQGAGRGQVSLLLTSVLLALVTAAVVLVPRNDGAAQPWWLVLDLATLAVLALAGWVAGLTAWATVDTGRIRWRLRGPRSSPSWDQVDFVEFAQRSWYGVFPRPQLFHDGLPRLMIILHGPRVGRWLLRRHHIVGPAVAAGMANLDLRFGVATLQRARAAGRPVVVTSPNWLRALHGQVPLDDHEVALGRKPETDIGFGLQVAGVVLVTAGIVLGASMFLTAPGGVMSLAVTAVVATVPVLMMVGGGVALVAWGRRKVLAG